MGNFLLDSFGEKIKEKDSFGRNVVDKSKTGKSRLGEYNVEGYTWVNEHVRGDPAIAEIKTHMVMNKRAK